MKSLHCPNPRCTNTFSAAEVQRTGVVKCPTCGQEFRFRPTPPPTIPPPAPMIAMPVAAAPKKVSQIAPPTPAHAPQPAAKATPAKPVASKPVPAMPAPMPAMVPPPANVGKATKVVRVRAAKRSYDTAIKFAVVFAVLAIVGGAGYVILRSVRPPTPPVESVVTPQPAPPVSVGGVSFKLRNEKVLTLNIDRKEWSADDKLARRLKTLFVFRPADDETNSWFAVAVQDFGTRMPRDSEMLSGAVERLSVLFGDTLQINSSKIEPTKLGGLDAKHCAFQGTAGDKWAGECYVVAHQGFGYWIFVAAKGSLDEAQQMAKRLEEQKAFTFVNVRPDWAEQPPALQMFSAAELAFSVRAPDNVWQSIPPKTEDESGVIYLAGNFQNLQGHKEDKSLTKNATVLGVALDKRTDLREAFKEAFAYLEKKKQDESADYRFEPVEAGANLVGELEKVGDLKGCVGELRLTRGGDRKLTRYVVLAAFNDSAKTYALRFECPWDNRDVWKKEFQDMIKTVRLGQK